MRIRKYFLFIFFLTIVFFAVAENQYGKGFFSGIWVVGSDNWTNDDFLIINRINEKFLVITADTDDDGASKGIGERISDDTIEVKLRNLTYKLVYGRDGENEWIEMYITPYDEEYPVYERVEKFSIDKF